MVNSDGWDPQQYEKFKAERAQPFFDLLALVEKKPAMRTADLGSGTGELTKHMHDYLQAASTVGFDNSPAMLANSAAFAGGGLAFQALDINDIGSAKGPLTQTPGYDLIFANASLQWCEDHPELFRRLKKCLQPKGQLAIQMPMNHDYPTHTVAAEVASQAPFAQFVNLKETSLLKPEAYAELLFTMGFQRQVVRLQVYAHLLSSRAEVIEWVKGTLLTSYQKRMPEKVFVSFLEAYREALFQRLADRKPFFYPFKRILIWGSL